jgi:hypothetical protein
MAALPPSLAALLLFALVFVMPNFWGDRFRFPLNIAIPLMMAAFVYAISSLSDTAGLGAVRPLDLARTDLLWRQWPLLAAGFVVSAILLTAWAALRRQPA